MIPASQRGNAETLPEPALDPASTRVEVYRHPDQEWLERCDSLVPLVADYPCLSLRPSLGDVVCRSLGQIPYLLVVRQNGEAMGFAALAHLRSRFFGTYLSSLPYLNYAGIVAADEDARRKLVARAIQLADELGVKYLLLRQVQPLADRRLRHSGADKVHMRLELPSSEDDLWKAVSGKVRNQVRKARKQDYSIHWGGTGLLGDFYRVFTRNMRDLGSPCYPRRLFAAILDAYPHEAELCVVRDGRMPIAGGLLLHGVGITEVPSASSLREYNSGCSNMLLYWHLLTRAIERGQQVFDFGRSTVDSGTYRFKKQWGARPEAATWYYYHPGGQAQEAVTKENPRFQRVIRWWQRMPVWLTRILGPRIVRGIP